MVEDGSSGDARRPGTATLEDHLPLAGNRRTRRVPRALPQYGVDDEPARPQGPWPADSRWVAPPGSFVGADFPFSWDAGHPPRPAFHRRPQRSARLYWTSSLVHSMRLDRGVWPARRPGAVWRGGRSGTMGRFAHFTVLLGAPLWRPTRFGAVARFERPIQDRCQEQGTADVLSMNILQIRRDTPST